MINSPIEEIKSKLDIVDVAGGYIKLQKAGVNYRACCPFHSEKSPSFFISPARQIWHCFGSCGEGGDIFKFVMKIEGVEFGEALRILAQKAGVELKKTDPQIAAQNSKKDRLLELTEIACKFFEKQLESGQTGKEVKGYFHGRGVSEESVKKWRLGYSPESWDSLSLFLLQNGYSNSEIEGAGLSLRSQKSGKYFDRFRGRIIFPIFDLNSRVVGFGGRVFKNIKRQDGSQEAKYINSPATLLYDKSRVLYGLNNAGVEIRRADVCILVEGYMDAIMAHQAGTQNVVATSGTALTPYQLKILKRYSTNLYTSFDMDVAGGSATRRGIDLAQTEGFDIKVVVLPGDKDPADLVLRDPDAWKQAVLQANTIHDFYFSTILSKFDKNTVEGKKEIAKFILPIIRKIPNRIEQGAWIKNLSEHIGIKEEDVLAELGKINTKQEISENPSDPPVVLKNRKGLLEERIAMLMIKNPVFCQSVEEKDLKLFSLSIVNIIDYLIKNKGLGENIPDNLSQKINHLFLKADQEIYGTEQQQEEFNDCLTNLKVLCSKEELSSISSEIKKAEKDNDFQKIKNLIDQFNNLLYGSEKNKEERGSS
ncbi:MAG: DNA primase [bacterium]|nr:DNA primase [bacterium]